MRTSKKPRSAITMRTYAELDEYVRGFAQGHLTLLIIIGAAGLQKSRIIRHAVDGGACWIEGHATPFGIYRLLWEHRDEPVVIDDVDGLYSSRDGVRLLKCLCQTELRKTVTWYTNTALKEGLPLSFTTHAKVAIIANEWATADANVAALEDRGICLHFAPTPLEVHVRTADWFWDQQVFDFIADHLHLFAELSMRLYCLAWELKTAGMDWCDFILKRCMNEKACLVAELKRDPGYPSEEDRVRAFIEGGGGSRATYFNYAKKLMPTVDVPKIKLTNPPPEGYGRNPEGCQGSQSVAEIP